MKYRYFTKKTLIEAAKAGNERGYNRQLDLGALQDLQYPNFLPLTFTMIHEHIAGEQVEPHVRAMVQIGDDQTVTIDMSQERYDKLPEVDTDHPEAVLEGDTSDAGHRIGKQ